MSQKKVETVIEGVHYRLTQLGGETISDLGFEFTEAVSFKHGLSVVLKKLRTAYADKTEVQAAGKWVPLMSCDGWWDDKPRAHGAWISWTNENGGLADFLAGMVKSLPPGIQALFASVFRREPRGGSTASSTPPGDASAPAQS